MTKDLSYTKILTTDASFQLVRTNPKLTGNVKLTINESGEMWLDAIKANLELAKDDYSRFPIDTTQSLASNYYRFFKNGQTPNEIIFSLSEKVDTTKTSKDYKDQFDFSNYFSGIKYFPSNQYSEKLSYFAPLYLKKEIPNYFIILKIKDPLNEPIDLNRQKFEEGQTRTEYLMDLFKKASIVKTFDLSENSTPGKFIRNYLKSSNFPISPLTVAFDEDDYTTWNGIMVDAGAMGSRGEMLYNQYIKSTPLKFFEEVITKGYERNGVIFPNILNLEFVFDDDTSQNYEINRYLGLYVNTIEISELDIDLDRAYSERGNWPNTPRFRKQYYEYDETHIDQSNSNGVIVPYKNIDFNMIEFTDIFADAENLYFNYLTDKNGKLYSPRLDAPYAVDLSQTVSVELSSVGTLVTAHSPSQNHGFETDDLIVITSSDSEYTGSFFITKISDTDFTYEVLTAPTSSSALGESAKDIGVGKLTLGNTKIDLANFFGPRNNIFLQDTGFVSYLPGYSYSVIKINSNLNHLDKIKLYHPNGTQIDADGKYDVLTATVNYAPVNDPGEYYAYNDYDNVVGHDVFYFNAQGLVHEIAEAIVGCLNNIRSRTFTAYSIDDHVFIKCNSAGDFDALHKIEFISPTLNYNTVELDGTGGTSLIGTMFLFKGGSKPSGNRLVLDHKHLDKINNKITNLLVKTEKGWSRIIKTSRYTDLVNEENLILSSTREKALAEYKDKIVVTLELSDSPTISYTQFLMKEKFRPEFGLISMFPIRDIDFDFYSSEYLNFPIIDLYQHYYIPSDVDLLVPGTTYYVINGSISVDAIEYIDGDSFTVAAQTKYSRVSGTPIVSYYSDGTSGSSLSYPINDANRELQDFTGFSILKDPTKIIAQQDTLLYNLKTKYLNGLTNTEYDFYKENETSDFALRSKVIPYITKWGIKDGFDSRDNAYRLNTELIFGRNNFAPDHNDRSQNPNNFTHEWFYIESKFNYMNDASVASQNNYYFDSPFDAEQVLSNPDYFIEYFTYAPWVDLNANGEQIDVAATQFRYSNIFKNKAGEYETFFKGFKAIFKDVTNPNVFGEDGKPIAKSNSSRFEGYKFSCLLKPVKEDFTDVSKPPIRYRVIEHQDYKHITILIEVAIGSIDQVNDYWKQYPLSALPVSIGNDPTSSEKMYFADPNYSTELGSSDLPYQTVNGDYRISFDQINGVSNVTHAMLYSMKHKKYNNILNNFSNVKLSSRLQIDNGIDTTNRTIKKQVISDISNYPSIVSDEIILPSNTTFVSAYNTIINRMYFIDNVAGVVPQNTNVINGASDDYANYEIGANLYLVQAIPTYPYTGLFQSIPTALPAQSFRFSITFGGEQYFEKLIEKISFARFKKYINESNPIIEYLSYSLDGNGNSVLSNSPNFYIELTEQSEIYKKGQLVVVEDTDKPTQYAFSKAIGYKYSESILKNLILLNRYKGEYEPVTKNLLHCRTNFKFSKNKISDLKLSNTKLNTYVDNLMSLQNFNHIKIAPTKILELESDPTYSPVYPKIGEIAIGQADHFLLNSNWDWGFHKKYSTDKVTYSPVAGSIRVEEDENFLGKIIALPNEIELEQFNLITLTDSQKLTDVDLSQIEIVVKENETTFDGYINLNNALTSYFINHGIEQAFNAYLVNSNEYLGNFESIQAYVKEYIKLNILKLFEIETVEFYTNRNATLTSSKRYTNSNAIEFAFLNDEQRFNQGYSILKSVKINKTDRLILSFSIQKSLDAGFNVSPKIKTKFI